LRALSSPITSLLPTDDAVAVALLNDGPAQYHDQAEAGLQAVFRLTGSAEVEVRPIEPIKLLEVNTNTVASGVLPVQFGPAPASGIPYPSIIVEVSPEEFEKIKTKELKLPKGWQVGEEMPRPADAPGVT
jgi:hypothetical protein